MWGVVTAGFAMAGVGVAGLAGMEAGLGGIEEGGRAAGAPGTVGPLPLDPTVVQPEPGGACG